MNVQAFIGFPCVTNELLIRSFQLLINRTLNAGILYTILIKQYPLYQHTYFMYTRVI